MAHRLEGYRQDSRQYGTVTLVSVGDLGGLRGVTTATPSYKGHRYPVEIINHCVWLYFTVPAQLP